MSEPETVVVEDAAPRKSAISASLAVMIASPVLIIVTAAIVGFLIETAKRLFTGQVNGLVHIGSAIAGAVVGVFVTHWAAQSWFPAYNSRAVFVWLATLSCASIIYEAISYPFNMNGVTSYGQMIAVLVSAYFLFWSVPDPAEAIPPL